MNDSHKEPLDDSRKDPLNESHKDPLDDSRKDPLNDPLNDSHKDPLDDSRKYPHNDPLNGPLTVSVPDNDFASCASLVFHCFATRWYSRDSLHLIHDECSFTIL